MNQNKKLTAAPCVIGVLIFADPPAMAGQSFITDDPEPVEYQHHAFCIASQQTRRAEGKSGTIPHVEYNYGATPNLQLHLLVHYAFNNGQNGQRQSGLGDIELGAKYRFRQETDNGPMVGIIPPVIAPTGNGAAQFFLPASLQKSWGTWQSYGNHWFFGWQLQKDIAEHLTLGGGIFHSTEQVPAEGGSNGMNLGSSYNFDEHNHLLFPAGKGLTHANTTNHDSSYFAYQLTC